MTRLPGYWKYILPELPEVETISRTLSPHVLGRVITGAEVYRSESIHQLSLPPEKLAGYGIDAVGRRGKLLLLELGSMEKEDPALPRHLWLGVHLRMTGRIYTRPAGEHPGKHTRCIFHLSRDHTATDLFFDDIRCFGRILAAPPDIFDQWDFWRNLGPEPLAIGSDDFELLFRGRNSAIKTALLDQGVIAGIGNIYADELLFQAGVSPLRKASSLDSSECLKIWHAMRDVLERAISQCGSSIRDYRDANGDAGAFQNGFAVYGKGMQPCVNCGQLLIKTRVAGRSTVYCPHCQK